MMRIFWILLFLISLFCGLYAEESLYSAILAKDSDTIELIFQENKAININESFFDGSTALICAVKTGDLQLVKMILKKKPNILQKDKSGFNCFFYTRNELIIKELLAQLKNISIPDEEEKTLVDYAVEQNNLVLLQVLNEEHVDLKKPDERNIIPLEKSRDEKIIDYLLKNSGYINYYSKDGKNILMRAVENDNYELTKALLEKGFSIMEKNIYGDTVHAYAFNKKMLELILKYTSAKIPLDNITLYRDKTKLMAAVEADDLDFAKYLLEKGVDINKKNNQGQTALILAVIYQKTEMLEFLLKSGAKKNIQDNYGKTAEDYAKNKYDLAQKNYRLFNAR